MPLDDLLPPLDDRTYDDLVSEIRTRISRYAPEWRPSAWTDLNDNDPGITLTQVFAWLCDMLLYRLNRVPTLTYVKFLDLIGIKLTAAAAAQAEVTLPVAFDSTVPKRTFVLVPERTQLSADPGDGGPTLIFETTRSLVAFRAAIDAVASYDPATGFMVLTDVNAQAAQGFEPFGARAPKDAYLAIGLQDPEDLPGQVLDFAVVATGDQGGVPYVTSAPSVMTSLAPATLVWEYCNAGTWSSLTVLKDDTLALTRTGHVVLKLPSSGITAASKCSVLPSDTQTRYWLRARVVDSQYERPPELLAIRMNTVPVEQAETIRDETVGGSDGTRNQTFQLANAPVLPNTLKLDIQVSDENPDRWVEVADLDSSGPNDNVFTLDGATGEIRTGDGEHGNVPVAYASDPDGNVVAREYRFGGGSRGNVPAGAISTLVTAVAGIDPSRIANLQPAHSGREQETLDEAKDRAPATLRSRDRAVSAADFEYLAEQAGTIRRAKALPGFHPDFPGVLLPGVVSVVVVPDAAPDAPNPPMPSDGTLRTVCQFLDERRLLTTEVFVLKPTYQRVEVRGEIIVLDAADSANVHDALVDALREYFDPLRGGDDTSKPGWPFGGTISYARVYQRVAGVAGVSSITSLVIALDDEEQPPFVDVNIDPHGLLYSTDHALNVHFAGAAA